jgi:pimeloyl-ACP methyl ester carboxylesterase
VKLRKRVRAYALTFTIAIVAGLFPALHPFADAAQATKPLRWVKCPEGPLLCATVRVPVNRIDPTGDTIALALVKRVASPRAGKKIGTLLAGSGFPGNSGIFAMSEDVEVPVFNAAWLRFDVIGFDQRGTGQSNRVQCATEPEELGITAFTTDEDYETLRRTWTRDCVARNPISAHTGPVDIAFDIEAIRKAIGVTELSFQFWNLDAKIASTYAGLFPTRVRSMVLIDPYPTAGANRYVLDQAIDTEVRLTRFIEFCAKSVECALNGGAGPAARIDALLARLEKEPIPFSTDPEDGVIERRDLMGLFENQLGDENGWAALAQLVARLEVGDNKNLNVDDFTFTTFRFFLSSAGGAFWSIACRNELYPRTEETWNAFAAELETRATRMKWAYLPGSAGCIGWPIPPEGPQNLANRTKTPALILHRNYGRRLPAVWANDMVATLGRAQLLTANDPWDSCVTDNLKNFLERKVLPNTQC